jgi:hypothetical protein
MRPQVRAFRNAASQVCQARRFSFREFMEDWGLEDILNEAETGNWSAKEIASQVLARCFGSLGGSAQQAFTDLVAVLNNPGTPQAIMSWLDTHYP